MASASKPPAEQSSGDLVRSLLTLAILIHFCCVGVVLASNFRRSPLQSALVSIFAFYTQLLDFDPDFTPYYYTLGREEDDDARIVIELYPDAYERADSQKRLRTIELPSGGSNWLGDRRRYFAVADIVAINAVQESDEINSQIVRGIGQRVFLENPDAKLAVVRCIRRLSQPVDLADLLPGFPRDNPAAAAYDREVYVADVQFFDDGVTATRRAAAADAAPLRGTSDRQTPPAATP